MKDYKKSSCVKCQEAFDDNSDIVVCPECGAPHHRECWKEIGHCALEEKHSAGYEWQPEKKYIGSVQHGTKEEITSSVERVICPNCGRSTKKSEKYCEYCGYFIYKESDPFADEPVKNDLEELFQFEPGEMIQGVPAGDIKRFVGNMWIYYIPRFIRMSRSKSPVSFNFTAFFAHGFWFVSRKMYLLGIVMILTVTGSSLYQAYFASVMDQLTGNRLALGSMLSLLLSALEFIIMILSGLFGNRVYLNYCVKKIKKINSQLTAKKADADEFNGELESSGGVAMIPAFSMILCYLAVVYIIEKGFLF
ncbi:MAG: DUF2628 domain-containing protein [Clostridia bacterium]|nr:DUF2628 domain-containing protein [Clostridia bacterium]